MGKKLSKTIMFTIANAPGTVYKFRFFQNNGFKFDTCDTNRHQRKIVR